MGSSYTVNRLVTNPVGFFFFKEKKLKYFVHVRCSRFFESERRKETGQLCIVQTIKQFDNGLKLLQITHKYTADKKNEHFLAYSHNKST